MMALRSQKDLPIVRQRGFYEVTEYFKYVDLVIKNYFEEGMDLRRFEYTYETPILNEWGQRHPLKWVLKIKSDDPSPEDMRFSRIDPDRVLVQEITVSTNDKLLPNMKIDFEIEGEYINVDPFNEPDVIRTVFFYKRFYQECYRTSESFYEVQQVKGKLASKLRLNVRIMTEEKNVSDKEADFERYFENKELSDVIFVVGDEQLKAHKQFLAARSRVFAKMFEYDLLGKKGQVNITDIEPNVFKTLLHFIYRATIDRDLNCQEWLKLAKAAEKYSIPSLLSTCENALISKLVLSDSIDILIQADHFGMDSLKAECRRIIFENQFMIVDSKPYEDLIEAGRADLISDLLSQNINIFPIRENLKVTE